MFFENVKGTHNTIVVGSWITFYAGIDAKLMKVTGKCSRWIHFRYVDAMGRLYGSGSIVVKANICKVTF